MNVRESRLAAKHYDMSSKLSMAHVQPMVAIDLEEEASANTFFHRTKTERESEDTTKGRGSHPD